MAIEMAFIWDWVKEGIASGEEFIAQLPHPRFVTRADWENLVGVAKQALAGGVLYRRASLEILEREERVTFIALWRD